MSQRANAAKDSASVGSESPFLSDGTAQRNGSENTAEPAGNGPPERNQRLSLSPKHISAVLCSDAADTNDHESQPTWKTSPEDAAYAADALREKASLSRPLLSERLSTETEKHMSKGFTPSHEWLPSQPPSPSPSPSLLPKDATRPFSDQAAQSSTPFAPAAKNQSGADSTQSASNARTALLVAFVQSPLLVFTLLLPAKLDGKLAEADYVVVAIPLFLAIAVVGGILMRGKETASTVWPELCVAGAVFVLSVLGAVKADEDEGVFYGWMPLLLLLGLALVPVWARHAQVQVRRALDEAASDLLHGRAQVAKSPSTTRHLRASHQRRPGRAEPARKRSAKDLLEGHLFLLLELAVQLLTIATLVGFAGALGRVLDRRGGNHAPDSSDYGQAFLVWHYASAMQLLGIAWACLIDHGMWPAAWGGFCVCYDHHLDDRACLRTIAAMLSAFLPLFAGSVFLALLHWRLQSDESQAHSHYVLFLPIYVLQALGLCVLPLLAMDPFHMVRHSHV